MKEFIRDNLIVWIWLLLAIFTELFSICFTDCSPFITNPLYSLILLGICFMVLIMITNKTAKSIVASVFYVVHVVVCIGFVLLYEQNGTAFDFSMLSQRNDAFGTLETLNLNPVQTSVLVVLAVAFIAFVVYYIVHNKRADKTKGEKIKLPYKIASGVICAVLACSMIVVPVIDGVMASKQGYENKLYNQNYSRYQTMGITANAIYELFSGSLASRVDTSDIDELDAYLFGDGTDTCEKLLPTSQFNGISAGKNLVMIMVESFDWYPLTWYDAETTAQIFPNITKLMGQSVVLDGFYSREKTDTAENNALLGSNSSNKTINYDFPDNEYPFSMPNMFRSVYPEASIRAFHQNNATFYNRDKSFVSIGFDEFYGIEAMEPFGVVNNWNGGEDWGDVGESMGERTRDSETMLHMVEEMFPLDEQFYTYWLTFTMHGYYAERENLGNFTYNDGQSDYEGGYYGYFDAMGVFPESDDTNINYLRTYAAALKDFDVALGIMLDYFEENLLLEDTTIVIYADHNTYYNNLSAYGKNIDETYNSELYRVPCFIYDQDLYSAYYAYYGDECLKQVFGNDENPDYECLTLSKFTTTTDLIPTILDLFGISGWANLYLGNSVFIDDVESIIYSRAYGIFVTDKLICYSVNNLLYTYEGFTDADRQDFIERAEAHLIKQEYLDKIYYSDYFSKYDYKIPLF